MFIEYLVQDVPVGWKLERYVTLAMTVGNIVAGIMFFVGIGFRSDIAYALETARFLLKFAVTLPLVITATAAIMRAASPGASFGLSGWGLALAPAVFMSALLIELMVVPSSHWVKTIVCSPARPVVSLIPILSLG